MLCRVDLVRTDDSEAYSASIVKVTRIGELGTTLQISSYQRTLRSNTIPEDRILHSHSRENLKSYKCLLHLGQYILQWPRLEHRTGFVKLSFELLRDMEPCSTVRNVVLSFRVELWYL
jgi:hypothetical protein